MSKDINESKLIGGKRKNGHKLNCNCHICENMKNKAKRGGYKEEIEKEEEKMMGGSKKKNGHRKDCKCPICKNMNNSRKRGKPNKNRKSKKLRGGDGEEEEEVEEVAKEDVETPSDEGEEKEEAKEKKDKESSDEGEEKEEESESSDEEEENEEKQKGGRKKKGNGHKANCKCPICRNMRKSKKGGDIENQLPDEGDIEEGGIQSTSGSDLSPSTNQSGTETPAKDDEYDDLIATEEGRADKVGGTRRKRKGRKSRKTRKHRRHRR